MDASPPDLDALLRNVAMLVDAREVDREVDPGEGNFNCEDCSACYNCRFCEGCDSCEDCTYCDGCVDCLSCTQSKRSVSCEGCAYIEDSRECERSRYLVLCVECVDCVHCLGCVGLRDAEYSVLNESVGKKKFYEVLNWVRAELERRAAEGWRPELIGLMGAEADDGEPEGPGSTGDRAGDDQVDADDEDPWHRPREVSRSKASRAASNEEAPPWRDDVATRPREPLAPKATSAIRRGEAPPSRRVTPGPQPGPQPGPRSDPASPRRSPAPGASSPPLPARMPWEDSQVIETRVPSPTRPPEVDATPADHRERATAPTRGNEAPSSRPAEAPAATRAEMPAESPAGADPSDADARSGLRRGQRPPRR